MLSVESAKECSHFHVFSYYFFLDFATLKKVILWTNRPWFNKPDTTSPPPKFPLFPPLSSEMSRNMCILRHNLPNGQNLPHLSQFFKNIFVLSNLRTVKVIFSFLLNASGCLETCVAWR